MPIISLSNSIEQRIEQATNDKQTSENWADILDIADLIESQPNGARDAVRALMKRLKNKVPRVGLLALTVLDACVSNAKRRFHLELSSRFFDDEVRGILQNSQNYNRQVVEKLCQLIKKWAENEFKSDPALSIIPALYNHIRNTNPSFITEAVLGKTLTYSQTAVPKPIDAIAKSKEEEDFAKAIALSLEEDKKKKRSSSTPAITAPTSLYPSMNTSTGLVSTNGEASYATMKPKEPRKVRAMYDFEAVEDNELTFKSGEIIQVLDDSDANWWKGSNHRGEGLFPTNFVTSDLNWEPENEFSGTAKKREKEETPSEISEPVEIRPVKIDEALIDRTLNAIHDADPTGERADPEDLMNLEDQCSRMWPLIDDELQKTDRIQSTLEDLSTQINEALAMYDTAMKEQTAMYSRPSNAASEPAAPLGYYLPDGSATGQYPPQQGFYHDYAVNSQPGYAPTGLQHPPPQGFQPFVPNAAKLAAAGGGGMQQQAAYPQQSVPSGYVMPPGHSTFAQPPQ